MQKPLLSLLSFIARPDVKLFGLARYRSMIGIYDGRMDVLGKKAPLFLFTRLVMLDSKKIYVLSVSSLI
jgi:hypothetical protein